MARYEALGVLLALAACGGDRSIFLEVPGSGDARTLILDSEGRAPLLFDLESGPVRVDELDADARIEALLYRASWMSLAENYVVAPGALELVAPSEASAPLPSPEAVYTAALGAAEPVWRAEETASAGVRQKHVAVRSACVPFDSPSAIGTVGLFETSERYTYAVHQGGGMLVGWPGRSSYVSFSGCVSAVQSSTITEVRAAVRVDPGGDVVAAGVDGKLYDLNVRGEVVLLSPYRTLPAGHRTTKLAAELVDGRFQAASIDKSSGSFVVSDRDGIREVHRFMPNDPRNESDAAVLLYAADPRGLIGLPSGGPGWIAAVPSDPELVAFADGTAEAIRIGPSGFSAATVVDGALVVADINADFWRRQDGEWDPIEGLPGAYILNMHPFPRGFIAGGIGGRLQLWVENGGYCPSLMLGFGIETMVPVEESLFLAGPVPNERGLFDFAFVPDPSR